MRGQISLDLLLSVLVTLVILSSMFAAVEIVQQNYKEMYVINQLKKISSEESAFITSTNAISDMSFEIEHMVPKVQYENGSLGLDIEIQNDVLTAKAEGGYEYSSKFSKPPGATIIFDPSTRILKVINIA